jgi:uncharacterized protein
MSPLVPKSRKVPRRDFLKAVPVAAGILVQSSKAAATLGFASPARSVAASPSESSSAFRIKAFDYQGVKLRDSRWRTQVQTARDYYLNVSNDDILCGFRAAAGLPAPGKPLGGWCAKDSQTVFGQWLSGMARMFRATGDSALRNKASYLLAEWAKTIKPDGDCGMHHYSYDKMVCGLVDMKLYADNPDAIPQLEKITDWAAKTFAHTNMIVVPSHNTLYYGMPQEWYTLAENQFRAYQLTGNPKFKSFGEIWLYHDYWNKFANTSSPMDAPGVHAYSHVNTFSSAAMTYAVTGDPSYLGIVKNFYDFMQNTQCFATGGYGPNERFMASDGSLGKSLETRSDTFETMCGSWAGFKVSRYLTQFTGEARYGDWVERLLYNGAGAALALRPGGRNFYYSDYRTSGGMKVDYWDNYTCCSGTLFQDMADYHNLIYYKDDSSLYVSQYLPSEVTWSRPAGDVTLVQETGYPETETIALTLAMKQNANFSLNLRVPAWSKDMSVKVNGTDAGISCKAGEWAVLNRAWNSGDRVDIRIPLLLRMSAVDQQHPKRVAIVRGPVVLALDYNYHDPAFTLPDNEDDLNKWLVSDGSPIVFRVARPDGRPVRLKFRPFYDFAEDFPYLMYFDLNEQPYALW